MGESLIIQPSAGGPHSGRGDRCYGYGGVYDSLHPLLAVVVAPVADIESRPVSYYYPGAIHCVVWLAPVLALLIAAVLAFLGHGRPRS